MRSHDYDVNKKGIEQKVSRAWFRLYAMPCLVVGFGNDKKRGSDLSFCEDTEIWNLRSVDVAHPARFEINSDFPTYFDALMRKFQKDWTLKEALITPMNFV